MTYTIRVANAGDVPALLFLLREFAEHTKMSDMLTADEASLGDTMFGARPAAEALLALRGGEPIGLAIWFHNLSTFQARRGLYLEDLYVRPSERGAGIGKALLQRLAQIAVERDCARMEWVALNWNQPAIGFYRSLGARPLDQQTTFRLTGGELQQLAGAGG